MLASAWSVFCQAFELMGKPLAVKLFWADMEYLGMMISVVAFLIMAVRFAGYDRYITKRSISIVGLSALMFWAIILTDPYHGLMRTDFSLNTSAIPYTINKDYGMVYPLYLLFTYGMIMTSFVILMIVARKKNSLYRKQAVVLMLYMALMALPNIGFYFHLFPANRYDLSPAFFGPASLLMAWGIYRHKFLNIMPVARDLLIETMESGVIVADKENQIIDINQSAFQMLGPGQTNLIGKDIAELSILSNDTWPEDTSDLRIFPYRKADKEYCYELKVYPVRDRQGDQAGRLFILNDVTEQKANTQKIIEQQRTLGIMQERERLGRDLHDGLGQIFGYVNAQAQAVKEYLAQGKNDKATKSLNELITASRDVHGNIREYILEMRGMTPRNRNFSAVLKQYAFEFGETTTIPVAITFDDELPDGFPENEQAVTLMKIIQEALTNVRKHAGDCKVEISLKRDGDAAIICIEDTGVGFDPDEQKDGHHYGLSIMRERAREMGADLQIFSQSKGGVKVVIRLSHGGKL